MIHHVFNSALVSGPETLVLPNLVGFGQKVEIVLLQETRLPEGAARVAHYAKSLGFPVHEIPVRGRLDSGAVDALGALWAKRPPALVHAHGPKATLYSVRARRAASATLPLLTTHHGVRANNQSLKLRFFEFAYERRGIRHCDLCLTVCTSDRALLERRGIEGKRLAVHLNGVDRAKTAAGARVAARARVREAWLKDYGIRLDGPVAGIVGRLSKEKQHEKALDAFALLPDERAHLVCFGTGPLADSLKERAASLGLRDRVHWLGYRDNVAAEMAGFDLLLSLSSAEGLPINLIEAGWAATPVLAHGVDGVLDLIEDGKSGVLLDPQAPADRVARAIERLLGQPGAAAAQGAALQERVERSFSKKAWVARLEAIYGEFLRP